MATPPQTPAEQSGEKPKAFYKPAELAERWRVCVKTIRNEVARKSLRATIVGGQIRVSAEEVARYERRNANCL